MKKTKLTYADIEKLAFIVRIFMEDHKMTKMQFVELDALRTKLIVMRAEMEYLKGRESV
jgi:hypothetical protein